MTVQSIMFYLFFGYQPDGAQGLFLALRRSFFWQCSRFLVVLGVGNEVKPGFLLLDYVFDQLSYHNNLQSSLRVVLFQPTRTSAQEKALGAQIINDSIPLCVVYFKQIV